jgi:hypothetical protein
MTLAEFARQIEISSATARSWKARGKITQDANGDWRVAEGWPVPVSVARNGNAASPERDSVAALHVAPRSDVRVALQRATDSLSTRDAVNDLLLGVGRVNFAINTFLKGRSMDIYLLLEGERGTPEAKTKAYLFKRSAKDWRPSRPEVAG